MNGQVSTNRTGAWRMVRPPFKTRRMWWIRPLEPQAPQQSISATINAIVGGNADADEWTDEEPTEVVTVCERSR